MDAIESLTVEEAFNRVIDYIDKYPDDFEIKINQSGEVKNSDQFNPLSASFFKKYEEINLIGDDSKIRIFEDASQFNDNNVLVCKCKADDFEFCLEDGGAGLIERNPRNTNAPERFKSLFHFILRSV